MQVVQKVKQILAQNMQIDTHSLQQNKTQISALEYTRINCKVTTNASCARSQAN